MGRVCKETVQNRSANEKRPLSIPGIILTAHSCFAGRVSDTLRTPYPQQKLHNHYVRNDYGVVAKKSAQKVMTMLLRGGNFSLFEASLMICYHRASAVSYQKQDQTQDRYRFG